MHKPFKSISYKLSVGLAISTIIPLLIFCFFFYTYMCNSYREKYIEQSESTMSVSIENINHYVSTCITSALSVYYNSDVQNLLLYGEAQDFLTIESNQSKQLLSYMLSVYAATPDAVQIRLEAYRLNKSFLVTTKNLQRYIKTVDYSKKENLFVPNQVNVQSIHKMHSYDHFTTYNTVRENSNPQSVFTIHLPIYILPSSKNIMGMLSIDIPISFIENSCKYISYEGEENYVVDTENNIIFSSDTDKIGQKITSGSTLDIIMHERNVQDSTFNFQNPNNLLVLSKGFDSTFLQWFMIKTAPTEVIYEDVRVQLVMLLASFVICLIAAVLFNSISVLRYTIPLKKATDYMEIINDGGEGAQSIKISHYVGYNRNDEIGVLLTSVENMLYSINDFTIRQYKLDIANKTTELKMLQAQINPHFIYNTLQCLATRSLKNNDREQYDYISSLGQMMQYSMETSYPLVHLNDEITNADRYIQLQKMRFTNNLSVHWKISPDTHEIIVPKMILQPLIENSFKHGNLFQSDNGIIIIHSLIVDNLLYIYVIDNGCSVSEEQRKNVKEEFKSLRNKYNTNIDYHVFQQNMRISNTHYTTDSDSIDIHKDRLYSANNIGLSNVFLRLLLNFGSDCNMDIYANENHGTTVELIISFQSLWSPNTITEGEDIK